MITWTRHPDTGSWWSEDNRFLVEQDGEGKQLKLTPIQVEEIRLLQGVELLKDVSARYGVDVAVVRKVWRGEYELDGLAWTLYDYNRRLGKHRVSKGALAVCKAKAAAIILQEQQDAEVRRVAEEAEYEAGRKESPSLGGAGGQG